MGDGGSVWKVPWSQDLPGKKEEFPYFGAGSVKVPKREYGNLA